MSFFVSIPVSFPASMTRTRDILCRTIRFRAWATVSFGETAKSRGTHHVACSKVAWRAWLSLLGKRPHKVEFRYEADKARVLK